MCCCICDMFIFFMFKECLLLVLCGLMLFLIVSLFSLWVGMLVGVIFIMFLRLGGFIVVLLLVLILFLCFFVVLVWVLNVRCDVLVVICKFCGDGLVGVNVVVCICCILWIVCFGVDLVEILIEIWFFIV